jgi:hypothetical protein
VSLSYQHVHKVFFDAQTPEQANMVQLLTCSTADGQDVGVSRDPVVQDGGADADLNFEEQSAGGDVVQEVPAQASGTSAGAPSPPEQPQENTAEAAGTVPVSKSSRSKQSVGSGRRARAK